MDDNKRQELKSIGFTIPAACWLCKYSSFPSKGSPWGTCKLNQYEHKKHTGPKRELSIHSGGTCQKFQLNQSALPAIHGFAEFIQPTKS